MDFAPADLPQRAFAWALLLALGVAACASPAERIATALEDRGVPAAQARCMGNRLGDRLSAGQLERLNHLAKVETGPGGDHNLGQFLHRLDRRNDPQLVGELVAASLHCIV